MLVICINKLALKIMKENEMTLLPTQYICDLSRGKGPKAAKIDFQYTKF